MMFTGIAEEMGQVEKIKVLPQSARLTVRAQKVLEGTRIGDSIAVNGVCLTVVEQNTAGFTVEIMAETLAQTDLAQLKRSSYVNLERALQLQSRLGGHLVSGHIDGTGLIARIESKGIARVYEITAEPALARHILPRGSVAVDGISLTVIAVGESNFSVSLIPHTWKETTLGKKGVGSRVNLETDLIGKYVERFLLSSQEAGFKTIRSSEAGLNEAGFGAGPGETRPAKDLSLAFLSEHGFL